MEKPNAQGPKPNPEDYCREIEAYLCRKNDGHLIRIVGPAFEQVCGWATQGIPLSAAFRGIDRYFARYYAKGPRRRPVRIEFCEADVLDVFDEWRRAVGMPGAASIVGSGFSRKKDSLPAHLDRVIARLLAMPADSGRLLVSTADGIVRELDVMRSNAKSLRGEVRATALARLQVLDRALLTTARQMLEESAMQGVAAEADDELIPFRTRLSADAYAQARDACIDRLLRDRYRLPVIAFE